MIDIKPGIGSGELTVTVFPGLATHRCNIGSSIISIMTFYLIATLVCKVPTLFRGLHQRDSIDKLQERIGLLEQTLRARIYVRLNRSNSNVTNSGFLSILLDEIDKQNGYMINWDQNRSRFGDKMY
ncbi:MAG: hypothetical protein WBZ36_26870 [Candidatus Nitrosopolaris sp.]